MNLILYKKNSLSDNHLNSELKEKKKILKKSLNQSNLSTTEIFLNQKIIENDTLILYYIFLYTI